MPRISWKLGRVAGIDLYLHPSVLLWFLILGPQLPIGLTILVIVALFASITLHELGHALMARRYGIGTADITLYLIGGVARLQRMPRSSGPELLIALAGPAVNVVIAAVLFAVMGLGITSPYVANLLDILLGLNLSLALFNLLPAFPMDGGRVLRALLAGWLGRVRATQVAASLGQVLAVVGGIAGLAMGQWNLLILAAFIYLTSGMELRQVLAEEQRSSFAPSRDGLTAAPAGFRWSDRGDGVWRLVPTMASTGQRPWA